MQQKQFVDKNLEHMNIRLYVFTRHLTTVAKLRIRLCKMQFDWQG